jgi:glucokinase
MSRSYVVGLDMGGTNIRCAAVSAAGKVMLMRRGPARAQDTAKEIVENIATQILALEKAARDCGFGRARAIGVAVPGPLNLLTGTVIAAPHVKAWRSFPLRDSLEARLGRRVAVENDANAWALGEFWRGAARGRRDVVLLTLGTGVGGGIIIGGRIVHGRTGMAGELGHVTVEPEGMPCDCGAVGCLEAYASASGMRRLVEKELGLEPGARLPESLVDAGGDFSVRGMSAEARRGSALALSVFETAGRYLGIAVASFLNIFNPEMVVIGGGVGGALPFMRRSMTREIKARAFRATVAQARIVRAALGPEGGVVGAAYAALNPVRA